jgi:hypothetical protein
VLESIFWKKYVRMPKLKDANPGEVTNNWFSGI